MDHRHCENQGLHKEMNQEVTEEVEEGVSERELRESFRSGNACRI